MTSGQCNLGLGGVEQTARTALRRAVSAAGTALFVELLLCARACSCQVQSLGMFLIPFAVHHTPRVEIEDLMETTDSEHACVKQQTRNCKNRGFHVGDAWLGGVRILTLA